MRWTSALPVLLCLSSASGVPVLAQDRPAQSPPALDAQAIRNGIALYRQRCSGCHGVDALGDRGPDLTSVMASGVSDEQLFQTVRKGVPGTEMTPSTALDIEISQTLAYLRTLSAPAADGPVGDADNGERLFRANCRSCHRVSGSGGRLGPDLSRIGSARSRAALTREIRKASEYIQPGYEPVTLVTRDGQRIRGARKNEDAFSIQIMDVGDRIQGYVKADLREVIEETRSLMPDYGADRLTDGDLNDLLRYLGNQRGAATSR